VVVYPGGFSQQGREMRLAEKRATLVRSRRGSPATWERSGGSRIVTVETIGYVIAWVAFPLLMLSVTRVIDKAHRFFDSSCRTNWCQVPQSVLLVLVGIESKTGILGAQASETLDVVAAIATLVYEWYIARIALETTGSAAFVVLVDLVLGVTLNCVSGSLY
jgi:hypothetical protein